MSVYQLKNLARRLEIVSMEATKELDRVCGHDLWKTIGFDAFENIETKEHRELANYYYGQWQTARELQEALG